MNFGHRFGPPHGYDTQDFELDIVVFPAGGWLFKHRDVLADRVAAGQFSESVVDRVVHLGDEIASELDAGHYRWSTEWVNWLPPDEWYDAVLPSGRKAMSQPRRSRMPTVTSRARR